MVAVEVEVDLPDLGAEHPLERERRHLDHRHLAPLLAGRGGDLRADPARADDDQALTALDSLTDSLGVGEVAKVVDPVELGARDRRVAAARRRWPAGGGQ